MWARTPAAIQLLPLAMFSIQKFTPLRGSCRFLWRLTLSYSLWPCMSTIVPGIIFPLEGTVWPRFWAASPFSPFGRIPCLALLRLRKSSIFHFGLTLFLLVHVGCVLLCWVLKICLISWIGCGVFVIYLGLIPLTWISNCCLRGKFWSYRSQILFLIKEIQMGGMHFRFSFFFFLKFGVCSCYR